MKNVVIGFLGSQLDTARPSERWTRWRPSVGLCMQSDFKVDRFELLYPSSCHKLIDIVIADIAAVSPETTVNAQPFDFSDPWEFEEVYEALYNFARGYRFNLDEEQYYIHMSTGTHVCQICFFLLTESRHLPGRLLQTSPMVKGQFSPEGMYSVIDLDLSRYDRLAERFKEERAESLSFLKSGIATRSAAFNRLIEDMEKVAIRSRASILLMGPTGAGKSMLARRIFQLKQTQGQVDGRFVEVNCGTLRGDAAMSALFGHKKGAFTGSVADRQGLLRAANKGVVFLDEIGELGLDEQAMLLMALEEKRFYPLGSDVEVKSDFQLISGTNCDLVEAVRKGSFRSDLFARLNLWTFQLPGLGERREDIAPNIEFELQRLTAEHGDVVRFNKEALRAYLKFAEDPGSAWLGNFRDLNASLTRLSTLAGGHRITVELVAEEIQRLRRVWGEEAVEEGVAAATLVSILGEKRVAAMDPFDRVQLDYVLRICRDSRSLADAGRKLFAVSRRVRKTANDSDRLRKYLAKFDISWELIDKRFSNRHS